MLTQYSIFPSHVQLINEVFFVVLEIKQSATHAMSQTSLVIKVISFTNFHKWLTIYKQMLLQFQLLLAMWPNTPFCTQQ